MKRFGRIAGIAAAAIVLLCSLSLHTKAQAEVARRYLRDADSCGYTWMYGGNQYSCDLACYDRYINSGYVKHCYEIYHTSSTMASDPSNESGMNGWSQVIEMWQKCTCETVITPPTCTKSGKA